MSTAKGIDIVDEVYDQVYGQIEHMIKNSQLDLSNVDELIKAAMESIEFFGGGTSGTQKASIAKGVIIRILQDLKTKKKIDGELADGIITAVSVLGPIMFRLIVAADKGKFNLFHNTDGTKKKGGCCAVV